MGGARMVHGWCTHITPLESALKAAR